MDATPLQSVTHESSSRPPSELVRFLPEALAAAGVAPTDVAATAAGIEFRYASDGLDPEVAGLMVVFSGPVKAIASSLWFDLLLPWYRRRLGLDIFGPETGRELAPGVGREAGLASDAELDRE